MIPEDFPSNDSDLGTSFRSPPSRRTQVIRRDTMVMDKTRTLTEAMAKLQREESQGATSGKSSSSRVNIIQSFESGLSTTEVATPVRQSDECIRKGTLGWYRHAVRKIVLCGWFDACIGAVVVANAIVIGVEQSYQLQQRDGEMPTAIVASEHVFLCIYCVEILSRFFACGWRVIDDNLVRLDCLLVGGSILYSWILKPFATGPQTGGGLLMVLRIARLARLARTFRLFIKFRVLMMLVRGLVGSAETMLHTLIVLLIMLYVFSTIGIELITLKSQTPGEEVSEEFQAIVDHYFATLPDTMLTLMQFACLDSIGSIYRPMIQFDWILAVYFLVIIVIIPIVLMNLVTAIIVNGAMEQAAEDKDAQKLAKNHRQKTLLKKVGRLFHELDEDGSGKVSREEMGQMDEEEKEILCHLCGVEEDPLVIFDQLDVNGSGELDIDEFCSGIWKAVTAHTPIETQRLEKMLQAILEKQRECERRNEALTELMREMRLGMTQLEVSRSFSGAPADDLCRHAWSAADKAPRPGAVPGKEQHPGHRRRSQSLGSAEDPRHPCNDLWDPMLPQVKGTTFVPKQQQWSRSSTADNPAASCNLASSHLTPQQKPWSRSSTADLPQHHFEQQRAEPPDARAAPPQGMHAELQLQQGAYMVRAQMTLGSGAAPVSRFGPMPDCEPQSPEALNDSLGDIKYGGQWRRASSPGGMADARYPNLCPAPSFLEVPSRLHDPEHAAISSDLETLQQQLLAAQATTAVLRRQLGGRSPAVSAQLKHSSYAASEDSFPYLKSPMGSCAELPGPNFAGTQGLAAQRVFHDAQHAAGEASRSPRGADEGDSSFVLPVASDPCDCSGQLCQSAFARSATGSLQGRRTEAGATSPIITRRLIAL